VEKEVTKFGLGGQPASTDERPRLGTKKVQECAHEAPSPAPHIFRQQCGDIRVWPACEDFLFFSGEFVITPAVFA